MHIMSSMEQNKQGKGEEAMNEKIYKIMEHAGVVSIVTGIVMAAAAISSSVLLIVYGAKLLKTKKHVLI